MSFVTTWSRSHSPVGSWLLVSDGEALTGVYPESHRAIPSTEGWRRDDAWFAGVRDQLIAYFAGRLTKFTVPVRAPGSRLQQRVWDALGEIPVGATTTAAGLAQHVGVSSTRSVSAAVARNQLLLVVPCHRVLGADGSLTAWSGGLELKRWLLEHEATSRRAAGGVTPIAMAAVTPRARRVVLGA
ncbi:MAG: methylated-DNA--[protein]-cysteine S-methyltransferase [Myxococcaceae bacterium]